MKYLFFILILSNIHAQGIVNVKCRYYYIDNDGDGYGSQDSACLTMRRIGYASNNLDCDDTNPNVKLFGVETCGDGLDNDCDGIVDNVAGTYVGNVTFTTQAEVNLWKSCYTKIQGNLVVTGTNITNINSLSNITEVTGLDYLEITRQLGYQILQLLTGRWLSITTTLSLT